MHHDKIPPYLCCLRTQNVEADARHILSTCFFPRFKNLLILLMAIDSNLTNQSHHFILSSSRWAGINIIKLWMTLEAIQVVTNWGHFKYREGQLPLILDWPPRTIYCLAFSWQRTHFKKRNWSKYLRGELECHP